MSGPPGPPKRRIQVFFLHILDFNSKGSHHIASIFDMYININERVDVKQDGPSLIIEAPPPPRASQIVRDIILSHCGPYMKILLLIVFPYCIYIIYIYTDRGRDVFSSISVKCLYPLQVVP